ncbi:predicted protein [Histoplasma capsulatum G186AR]|uniref:Uncharacterized protein n=1 Tax=Ajellomyces capsulatus (strain G186AR / H82 / ATCC MYA-2454 / RMSCC 2432) TaxID=447093 RepID=C0P130_AJECG|nr:uncharacterized protein HCBG_09110 [Histoplasma capsulatum G186AR]EEH02666.1 predicted protein [Histoplasma capsulatum G186AR]
MAERTVLARDLFLSCPYNVLPDARILVDESCAPLPPIFIIYFPGRYPLTNNDPNLILNLDPLLTRNAVLEWYIFRGLRLASIRDHRQGSASVVATDSPRPRQTVDKPEGKARQRIQVALVSDPKRQVFVAVPLFQAESSHCGIQRLLLKGARGAVSGGLGGASPGAPPKSAGRGRVGGANRGLEFTPDRRDSEACDSPPLNVVVAATTQLLCNPSYCHVSWYYCRYSHSQFTTVIG